MRLRRKITVAFFVVSSLVSVLLAVFLYRFVERQLGVELRTRLKDIAHIGSSAVDDNAYRRLLAKMAPELPEADVAAIERSPDYQTIYDQLNTIRGTEPDLVRYAYILVATDDPDTARFVVDADVLALVEAGSDEEISHFNQPYDVSTIPLLKRALQECKPFVESDFVWDPDFKVHSVSAYYPIGGVEGGRCLGVLGVDITDRDMRIALDAAGSLAVRISLLVIVLALVVSITMGTLLTRSIQALAETVQRFIDKDFAARTRIKSRDEIGQLGQTFNTMAETIEAHAHNLEGMVAQRTSELEHEKQTSERLLLNVLPGPVAERLKQGEGVIVDRFDHVSVLFADIVGFTAMSAQRSPEEMVTMLNDLFSQFDRLADIHLLEKIKTIGDAYMVVAGVPLAQSDHALRAAHMALGIQTTLQEFNQRHGFNWSVRIGMHSGPLVAGIIGSKKFAYDLWGDTVNVASRLESQGAPGVIQVSSTTADLLRPYCELAPRGELDLKNRGRITTFQLLRLR